jgi:DMSO/TMAO reductase YedYZ molybdopterin-dependent catalytic subunit
VLRSALAVLFFSSVFLIAIPPVVSATEYCLIGAFCAFFVLFSIRSRSVSGRREFLERSGAILGGAAVLLSLFSIEPVVAALATHRLFPFKQPVGMRLAGITDLVTPPGEFYIMDKVLQYPQIGPPDWSLAVDGQVRTAMNLDYGALLALPRQSRYITMECVDNVVGGRLISNALWTGVPVKEILARTGAYGDTAVFHGLDTYPESTPVAELVAREALIAFGMNGETLPREHGYPARLIVPGIYGFKSVKWLTRVEITHGKTAGAWKDQGWNDTAVIHTTTRVDVAQRRGDEILLAGIAFAGNRGVSAVQVRVNRGPWQRATLGPVLSHETWVQWGIRVRGRGPASIDVRAIDGNGAVQTSRRRGPYPDGSSGWFTVTV